MLAKRELQFFDMLQDAKFTGNMYTNGTLYYTYEYGLHYNIDKRPEAYTNLSQKELERMNRIPWKECLPVDWFSVPVDTLIEVYQIETGKWLKRYYAGRTDGHWVTAWKKGATSKTVSGKNVYSTFSKARLIEGE